MAVFRAGGRLFYFAHVPKCGGSSIEEYLKARFGPIGMLDDHFSSIPAPQRWSRTSPQHIDWTSLQRLLPAAFFDDVFAVVRHPVSRIVSSYQFQVEVEKSISPEVHFSDWLHDNAEAFEENKFISDNHFRPQADLVPENGTVFHLEHGLDAVVPYLDAVTGSADGPRFIGHVNQRGSSRKRSRSAEVTPTSSDMALIRDLYAVDFTRFGYVPESKLPDRPAPGLDDDYVKIRDRASAKAGTQLNRVISRVRRKLRP